MLLCVLLGLLTFGLHAQQNTAPDPPECSGSRGARTRTPPAAKNCVPTRLRRFQPSRRKGGYRLKGFLTIGIGSLARDSFSELTVAASLSNKQRQQYQCNPRLRQHGSSSLGPKPVIWYKFGYV